ncbi:type II toxin-antitoxin system VapC family toxin [Ferrigenium sp. UT5]|uniref:type II toxin-antitoxin system VapC family toxin n=1 Tax=Ferrigenium sp. UT5 TaxID=3242105 RepID=UPI0038B37294
MRRVYLDACVVIYLMENVAPFSEKVRRFLSQNGDAVLCVSPLVRMEVLIKPLRESSDILAADYEEFLAAQNWLRIDDSTFERALQLRTRHGLKTPDALHLLQLNSMAAMNFGPTMIASIRWREKWRSMCFLRRCHDKWIGAQWPGSTRLMAA